MICSRIYVHWSSCWAKTLFGQGPNILMSKMIQGWASIYLCFLPSSYQLAWKALSILKWAEFGLFFCDPKCTIHKWLPFSVAHDSTLYCGCVSTQSHKHVFQVTIRDFNNPHPEKILASCRDRTHAQKLFDQLSLELLLQTPAPLRPFHNCLKFFLLNLFNRKAIE